MIDESGTDRKTREKAFKSGELTLASNWTEQAVGEISLWTVQSDLWPRRSTEPKRRRSSSPFVQMLHSEESPFFDSKQN
jgi:hypothetical protein